MALAVSSLFIVSLSHIFLFPSDLFEPLLEYTATVGEV